MDETIIEATVYFVLTSVKGNNVLLPVHDKRDIPLHVRDAKLIGKIRHGDLRIIMFVMPQVYGVADEYVNEAMLMATGMRGPEYHPQYIEDGDGWNEDYAVRNFIK